MSGPGSAALPPTEAPDEDERSAPLAGSDPFRLGGEPPRVMRLSRKTLAIIGAAGGTAISEVFGIRPQIGSQWSFDTKSNGPLSTRPLHTPNQHRPTPIDKYYADRLPHFYQRRSEHAYRTQHSPGHGI